MVWPAYKLYPTLIALPLATSLINFHFDWKITNRKIVFNNEPTNYQWGVGLLLLFWSSSSWLFDFLCFSLLSCFVCFLFFGFFFVSLRSRVPHRLVRWTSDRASVRGAGLYRFGWWLKHSFPTVCSLTYSSSVNSDNDHHVCQSYRVVTHCYR